jgi:YfiR/HmsC-like
VTRRRTPACVPYGLGLAALLLLVAATRVLASVDGPVDEYQVKAAFLLNFARFVDWPPAAFDSASAPIIIGIVGDDPFGEGIDRLIEHKTINGHPLEVRRFRDWKAVDKCHVLFVSGSNKQTAAKVIDAMRKSAVMTVGDAEGFALAGGVCNFTREGTRIGFEINTSAAARAGLTLSSRLLALARIVHEEGDPATTR